MTHEERLAEQLDLVQQDWWLRWADQQDLYDYAQQRASKEAIRSRVLRQCFTTINAAIQAGLVKAES